MRGWGSLSLFTLVLVVAGVARPASGPPASFHESIELPAGLGASGVALGDLDLDGNIDIVVANRESNSVAILFSEGGGRFEPPRFHSTDAGPRAVRVADMNADGLPDIVVVSEAASTVLVLLQDAEGRSFSVGGRHSTDDGPVDLVLADFDGDGSLDVATANRYSAGGTVSVLLGDGDGGFSSRTDHGTAPTESPFSGNPTSLAAADLDGDGAADLVCTDSDFDTVAVLRGRGNGDFDHIGTFAVGSAPVAVAVGDLDGDGIPDAVTANEIDWTVSFLRGRGDGAFEAAETWEVPLFPCAISLGDFNLDGLTDVAVAISASTGDVIAILHGNGDGTTQPPNEYRIGGFRPSSIDHGDLNGDGAPDLVTANFDNRAPLGAVSMLLSAGGPRPEPTISATPTSVPVSSPTATPPPVDSATSTPSPTATSTETPTRSPSPETLLCPGDCDGDGTVTGAELRVGVEIALAMLLPEACPRLDRGGVGRVDVADLIDAVGAARGVCLPRV